MDERAQEWLQWVMITSIPLRRVNTEGLPIGLASGCLVDYGGKRFLLSVQHAVDRRSNDWVIELGYDRKKGTQVYRPSAFNYVGELKLGSQAIRDIDFCYTEVPADLVSTYQNITPIGGVTYERERHVFSTDLTIAPDPSQVYGFSGQVLPARAEDALLIEMHVYPGLRYSRTEAEYHIFRLPIDHPGHEQFVGCSPSRMR